MGDQLTDDLRRYADALEEHLVASHDAIVIPASPRRRPWAVALAAAAALVVAVSAFVALDAHDTVLPVTTDDRDDSPGTTTPSTVASTTTTTPTTPSNVASTTTTIESESSAGDGVPNTTENVLAGSVNWIGRDPRASVLVSACPQEDNDLGCPSATTTSVHDDGSFTLTLADGTWRVAAYVTAGPTCVFTCSWPERPRNAVRSEIVTVMPGAAAREPMSFTVQARVVDVFVRDRNGEPFSGGGVQVTDAGCDYPDVCPEDRTPEFVQASPVDGAARLVLDPTVTYSMHGQAMDTGWPGEVWTNDGHTFQFSPNEEMRGDALDEGHIFRIDAAPAEDAPPPDA